MKIVYKNTDSSIAILTATTCCLETHTLEEIAFKDVPNGLPFWIVEDDEIPADRSFRDAWEIPDDWGEPDGYGSENNEFEEKLNDTDKQ